MAVWLDRDATDGESVKGERHPDFKITIIFPATDTHVRKVSRVETSFEPHLNITAKYTRQEVTMVRETQEIYQRIVRPYIDSFPKSRTQWSVGHCLAAIGLDGHRVEDILSGISESESICYSCPDFVILPDMKWDARTVSALYLVAIARDRELKSLRDLKARHLGMLNAIKREAEKIVNEKYEKVRLRMFVHYQPSYCKNPSLGDPFRLISGVTVQITFMSTLSMQIWLQWRG
jgi:m7GpppX diphosphatase